MKHFRVFLRGENFVLALDGTPTALGFYATRFVDAKTPAAAEILAVDLIRHDKKLSGVLNESNNPPMIFADEIEEIAASDSSITPGFTFYPMEDEGGEDA